MISVYEAKVISNQKICENIYEMVIPGQIKPLPGQFYMVKGIDGQYLLPRPISVHDYENGNVKLLYRLTGVGTHQLSRMMSGQSVQVFGPLGNGFDLSLIKGKVAIIGGGIGIAPLLYLSKSLPVNTVDLYLGFKDETYCINQFKNIHSSIYLSTEDGSLGHKGYITDLVQWDQYDTVVTCGPDLMTYKIIKICREHNIKVFASLEKRMACGIGACLGCVVKTTSGNQRACKEGPVFDGNMLVISEENDG